jgi:hypothetical protein
VLRLSYRLLRTKTPKHFGSRDAKEQTSPRGFAPNADTSNFMPMLPLQSLTPRILALAPLCFIPAFCATSRSGVRRILFVEKFLTCKSESIKAMLNLARLQKLQHRSKMCNRFIESGFHRASGAKYGVTKCWTEAPDGPFRNGSLVGGGSVNIAVIGIGQRLDMIFVGESKFARHR